MPATQEELDLVRAHSAEIGDIIAAIDSFPLFCRRFAKIDDKARGGAIPFDLYPAQVQVAEQLAAGNWLWIVKARQLGMTWLMAAYVLWRMLTRPGFECLVISQTEQYAADFVARVKFIWSHLPAHLKLASTSESKAEHTLSNKARLRSVASTARTGRSVTANLVIFDEAAYCEYLAAARQAAEPAVELAQGQIIGCSTAAGPVGEFYRVWTQAPHNRYTQVFLPWSAHPSRNAEWYARECAAHADDVDFVRREYPASAEEAFAASGHTCLASFNRDTHVGKARDYGLQGESSLYLGVDWGAGPSPFVCLWVREYPMLPPGLTIDPSCENLIREIQTWGRDPETNRPLMTGKHGPDAMAYCIVGANLRCRVHVEREMYVRDAAKSGHTHVTLARQVMSKTEERVVLAIADRAEPLSIADFQMAGIPCEPYKVPKGTVRDGDIEQRIKRLNAMFHGDVFFQEPESEDQILERKAWNSIGRAVEFTEAEEERLREIFSPEIDPGDMDDVLGMT